MKNKELLDSINNYNDGDILHVLPTNDLIDHDESEYCKCNPSKLSDCEIWVHNPLDGRQVLEQTVDILNE